MNGQCVTSYKRQYGGNMNGQYVRNYQRQYDGNMNGQCVTSHKRQYRGNINGQCVTTINVSMVPTWMDSVFEAINVNKVET